MAMVPIETAQCRGHICTLQHQTHSNGVLLLGGTVEGWCIIWELGFDQQAASSNPATLTVLLKCRCHQSAVNTLSISRACHWSSASESSGMASYTVVTGGDDEAVRVFDVAIDHRQQQASLQWAHPLPHVHTGGVCQSGSMSPTT